MYICMIQILLNSTMQLDLFGLMEKQASTRHRHTLCFLQSGGKTTDVEIVSFLFGQTLRRLSSFFIHETAVLYRTPINK